MAAPSMPENPASILNADLKMSPKTSGICEKFIHMTTTEITI